MVLRYIVLELSVLPSSPCKPCRRILQWAPFYSGTDGPQILKPVFHHFIISAPFRHQAMRSMDRERQPNVSGMPKQFVIAKVKGRLRGIINSAERRSAMRSLPVENIPSRYRLAVLPRWPACRIRPRETATAQIRPGIEYNFFFFILILFYLFTRVRERSGALSLPGLPGDADPSLDRVARTAIQHRLTGLYFIHPLLNSGSISRECLSTAGPGPLLIRVLLFPPAPTSFLCLYTVGKTFVPPIADSCSACPLVARQCTPQSQRTFFSFISRRILSAVYHSRIECNGQVH